MFVKEAAVPKAIYCKVRPTTIMAVANTTTSATSANTNAHPGTNYATTVSGSTMWVTPFQLNNGYTQTNWPNPGGCTGTFSLLQKAFPSANCIQWTGEQKNQAIQLIAQKYAYNILASSSAPHNCFQEVIISAGGKTVKAIVLDSSVPANPENVGDVSQSIIAALGGLPNSGHIMVDSLSFSKDPMTFSSPF